MNLLWWWMVIHDLRRSFHLETAISCYIVYCLLPFSSSSSTLFVYFGSYLVGDINNWHSTTGLFIFLRDSLISWKSKQQFIVSCSSVKVEYRDITHTMVNIVWLWHLLTEMGLRLSSTPLHCDNLSVHIDNNDVFHECAIFILR